MKIYPNKVKMMEQMAGKFYNRRIYHLRWVNCHQMLFPSIDHQAHIKTSLTKPAQATYCKRLSSWQEFFLIMSCTIKSAPTYSHMPSFCFKHRSANCWSRSLLLVRRWLEDDCCDCGNFCCWYNARSLPLSFSRTSCSTAHNIHTLQFPKKIIKWTSYYIISSSFHQNKKTLVAFYSPLSQKHKFFPIWSTYLNYESSSAMIKEKISLSKSSSLITQMPLVKVDFAMSFKQRSNNNLLNYI